uniref:Uncharacterized protein n=1 Tax=Zea mays TaxID=4577 RepID=A0A804NG74_MAIZE
MPCLRARSSSPRRLVDAPVGDVAGACGPLLRLLSACGGVWPTSPVPGAAASSSTFSRDDSEGTTPRYGTTTTTGGVSAVLRGFISLIFVFDLKD